MPWCALIELAYLLAIFGMVAAEGDVLQLEEVIALVTLERTEKRARADVLDLNKKILNYWCNVKKNVLVK